ncbi:unnamed protein product [Acanthoscelides obtectus]|uniref:BEN domain-containing protein n=1 Tax=Acanthoscelides obtectus TaxID=200917 RepID=A0A9P0M9E7_ACAOB|nr:unnamed protein product [Acanthoscelides obtectus]CAK1649650.1 Protein insensitive [Acanthoscelides obtectus]
MASKKFMARRSQTNSENLADGLNNSPNCVDKFNDSASSVGSACLDESIKLVHMIIYIPYSDPGKEFEIVNQQELVNTWDTLERGTKVTAKYGSARVQGIVVTISEDRSYLERNFRGITETFREDLRSPTKSSRLLARKLIEGQIQGVQAEKRIEKHVIKVMDRGTQTEESGQGDDYETLKRKYRELKADLERFTNGMHDVQSNLDATMGTLRDISSKYGDASSPSPSRASNASPGQENGNHFKAKVQIGSNATKIDRTVYDAVNWSSYTAATRKLLITVFPRKVLATHSLTGRPSPAFVGLKEKKIRLDPEIVDDIVEIVIKKCSVPATLVRSAITTKCADENKLYRKRVQKNSSSDSSPSDKDGSPAVSKNRL